MSEMTPLGLLLVAVLLFPLAIVLDAIAKALRVVDTWWLLSHF